MKKFITVLSLMMVFQASFAQDFKKVQMSTLISKFEMAKDDFDKIIAKKPSLSTTAEGYYWKAKIYNGIAKDATLAAKYPAADDSVKSALAAYTAADPTFAIAKENGTETFFDTYSKGYKIGADAFGAKDWKAAAANLNIAVKYSDIIFSQGWAASKQNFDTTTIFYAGIANQNANNVDEALAAYRRLVEANYKTSELIEVYKYILIQYVNKKDKSNFDTYLKIAEERYPNENWFDFKSEYIAKNYSLEEKAKLYDEGVASGKITEAEAQMYGDAFMTAKNEENNPNLDLFMNKAAQAYKKAYSMNPNNHLVAFNIGINYYNQFTVLDDKVSDNIRALQAINSNKPAAPKDPKKKAAFDAGFKAQVDSVKKLNVALEAPIKEKVDGSIEWLEKAFNGLKDKATPTRNEKIVLTRSVDFLTTLYGYKRDKSRGKDQKASDEYDVKYNYYDKLHDKYQ